MTRPPVLPSATRTASAPGIDVFRGSMAGLCAPLSTLRDDPRERRAWLGADVVRYSFIVGTFTPYSLPVSRRTRD